MIAFEAKKSIAKCKKDSLISRLLRFLIKIRFIPVEIDEENTKAVFNWCRSFLYFIVYWGLLVLCSVLNFSKKQKLMFKENVIDTISMYGFGIISVITFPLSPLILAKTLPSAPSVTLDRDLRWPKYGKSFILSFIFAVIGNILFATGNMADVYEGQYEGPLFIVGPLIQTFLLVSCWITPSLLVSAWMEKFIVLCKQGTTAREVRHAKLCLGLYSDIERGFGYFFFHVFVATQFLSIFMFFLAI